MLKSDGVYDTSINKTVFHWLRPAADSKTRREAKLFLVVLRPCGCWFAGGISGIKLSPLS